MLNKAINPIGIRTHRHTPHIRYMLPFQSFSNIITAAPVHCKYVLQFNDTCEFNARTCQFLSGLRLGHKYESIRNVLYCSVVNQF